MVSVTKTWPGTQSDEGVRVWIDFNRDGAFDAGEMVLDSAPSQTNPVSANFTVPATSILNQKLRMRVIFKI